MRKDKGVAGLTILLSLVTFLFIIGFMVMIFSLMGGELRDASYTSTTGALTNISTLTPVNETGAYITGLTTLRNCGLTVTQVRNASDIVITSGNYTTSGCSIYCDGCNPVYNNTKWNVTGSYTYDADNSATNVMNDTTSGIASVTDWFTIFIVIGAMVVLILLTVVIITAIKGSGFMQPSTA